METWRHGDMKTWRDGEMETWRQQTENGSLGDSSIRLPVTQSANGSLSFVHFLTMKETKVYHLQTV
jgi:hypothetical protein